MGLLSAPGHGTAAMAYIRTDLDGKEIRMQVIGNRILRCSDGHLFTSSEGGRLFLSLHFGPKRLMRCPVDHKWRMMENVNSEKLTEAELQEAGQHKL
jgi:hypothetical protein